MRIIIRFAFFIIFIFGFNSAGARIQLPESLQLSDSSYISLLTCDPGNQLYSAFGHSAVRVVDYKNRLNIVFNYGTFSFNTPNFYLKFAGGKLNYKLSVSSFRRFIQSYEAEKRMVVEQRLNLNDEQKQAFFNALMENHKPENREYLYDFFFDNCATRILDVLEDAMQDSLVYHANESELRPTFRNLIDEYLYRGSWSDFGIDLALGSVIDNEASDREQAFLPDYLSSYFDKCTLGEKPLVLATKIILPDEANFSPIPFLLSPWFVFWFAFALVLLLTILLRNKSWVIADRIIFSTVGLLGIITLLMWFATSHEATSGNINFIWANPLFIVLALYLNGKSNWATKYASIGFLIIYLVVIASWNNLPQEFNPIFIPIIALVMVRLIVLIIRSWKNQLV